MARNVEIKAHIEDLERTHRLVADAADRGPGTLTQTDTFFQVDAGRLKLREFSDSQAELIYYRRPDAPGPMESLYERVPVSDAHSLKRLLAAELGEKGVVHKKRLVYWVGRTRVHLDEVRDLGNFLELEVVLDAEERAEAGVSEARELMELFEIHEDSLLSDAYVDLLHRERRPIQT
jgi:predicted adenylyl cyclase CyaB